MSERDGGIVFVCTGRHTHPVTVVDRNEPAAAFGGGRKRNWTSPVTSCHEWRCPVCGRTLRLGTRRTGRLATVLAAMPDESQVDISALPV